MPSKSLNLLLIGEAPGLEALLPRTLGAAFLPCQAHRVSGLEAALQALARPERDWLVLLDLSFPGGLGLDFLRSLKTDAFQYPIVVLVDSESVGLQSVEEGAQDFLLSKELNARAVQRVLACAWARHALARKEAQLLFVDELTGLLNRRGFFTLAHQHWKLSRRGQRPFVLLFADMDGLKLINDRLGHQVGDEALRQSAFVLRQCFRESDLVARVGGDEFNCLLSDTSEVWVNHLIERVRGNLDLFNRQHVNLPYSLFFSFGAACFHPESSASLEDLLNQADQRMYADKMQRRQRARLSGCPEPDPRLIYN